MLLEAKGRVLEHREGSTSALEEDRFEVVNGISRGTEAHLGQLFAIVVADDRVCHAHAVQVTVHRLETVFVDFVGKDAARVAHHGSQVCGFAARCRGHVNQCLPLLWCQRNARQK